MKKLTWLALLLALCLIVTGCGKKDEGTATETYASVVTSGDDTVVVALVKTGDHYRLTSSATEEAIDTNYAWGQQDQELYFAIGNECLLATMKGGELVEVGTAVRPPLAEGSTLAQNTDVKLAVDGLDGYAVINFNDSELIYSVEEMALTQTFVRDEAWKTGRLYRAEVDGTKVGVRVTDDGVVELVTYSDTSVYTFRVAAEGDQVDVYTVVSGEESLLHTILRSKNSYTLRFFEGGETAMELVLQKQ